MDKPNAQSGRARLAAGILALAGTVTLLSVAGEARQNELDNARNRLLESYGRYNGITLTQVRQQLSEPDQLDRLAVFDAIVQAMFMDAGGGRRPIDYLWSVHAIWGRRSGDGEGRHQFRMSVEFDTALWPILVRSLAFNPMSRSGHVLMAVPRGADSDTLFKAFDFRTDATTFRKKGYPSLQISYLNASPTIGEIDLDFDEPPQLLPEPSIGYCHNQPSNSDPGSVSPGESHPDEFRKKFRKFSFDPKWRGYRHCANSYD